VGDYLFKPVFAPDYLNFMNGNSGFRDTTNALYTKLYDKSFDIIHVFNYLPMLMFSFMRDLFNSPVVFTFWNTPYKEERAIGFYDSPELDMCLAQTIIGLKKYDQLILGSRCNYRSALLLGASNDSTTYKYHGIDIEQFTSDLNRYPDINNELFGDSVKPNDILITLPGRITERKGIIEALEAIHAIRHKYFVKLLLTGMSDPHDPNFAQKVRAVIKHLGINNQVIIPKETIPRSNLPAVYKRSNIILTPSYYEGLGFTAIKALAIGRPLIATNVPGLNEVCNNKNALMIPARDSKALADAIIKLLSDNRLSARLSNNGPESVKMFDMNYFVYYLESQYATLIKNYVAKK